MLAWLLFLLVGQTTEDAAPTPEQLLTRQSKEKRSVWADGDTLTFVHEAQADTVSVLFGGDMLPMKKLGNSEVWYARKTLPHVARSFFSYSFMATGKGRAVTARHSMQDWRGPQAPPAVPIATKLQGTISEHVLDSKALGMKRPITVYHPPAGFGMERPRVIYMADGQGASGFAHVLEPLIVTKKIPPTMIIGVHNGNVPRTASSGSGTYDPKQDNRAREYLPTVDPEHFKKHETFFCEEVLPWAEHHFGVSRLREHRAVYGQSNSGRFAYHMGIRHPDLFGHIIAFSIAGRHQPPPRLTVLPMFHLAAGEWETSFLKITQQTARELAEREIPVCLVERTSGHDPVLWQHEFVAAVQRAWGNPTSPIFDDTKLPIPFQRFSTTDRYGRTITGYLSRDTSKDGKPKPIVLWIGGSGSQSLWNKNPSGQVGGGMQNLLVQLAKGRFRVLCVEKPGVQYLDWPKQPGSAAESSDEFRREHTLPRWAEANVAALRAAWQLPEIDRSRTLVVGHSEGALTASRVAAELPEVTHVAPLASAGATQLHGLVEFVAERAKTPEEGNALREKMYADWKKVQENPAAIDQFWMGHPHRRWSSFCRHTSVDELKRSQARIYLAQGTLDKSSHISELDIVRAELAVHGRDVVVERIIGADHGYRPAGQERAPGPPTEFQALLGRVLEWFLK
jgi:enterochelin esterase-like enzyme/pimeloyl-ACP methyl ester carboxylesterase